MKFELSNALEILERTPYVLDAMLSEIPDEWGRQNEGDETWSAFDVMGHLVHGERTDWMARLDIIMSDADEKTFTPFDRFAQFEESKGKTMNGLLREFTKLRNDNLDRLVEMSLEKDDFKRVGNHPSLGQVTLSQLISTWVVHDLSHISQISRAMAHQFKDEVGPWKEYLRVLEGK